MILKASYITILFFIFSAQNAKAQNYSIDNPLEYYQKALQNEHCYLVVTFVAKKSKKEQMACIQTGHLLSIIQDERKLKSMQQAQKYALKNSKMTFRISNLNEIEKFAPSYSKKELSELEQKLNSKKILEGPPPKNSQFYLESYLDEPMESSTKNKIMFAHLLVKNGILIQEGDYIGGLFLCYSCYE